jgi:hypothetical protein
MILDCKLLLNHYWLAKSRTLDYDVAVSGLVAALRSTSLLPVAMGVMEVSSMGERTALSVEEQILETSTMRQPLPPSKLVTLRGPRASKARRLPSETTRPALQTSIQGCFYFGVTHSTYCQSCAAHRRCCGSEAVKWFMFFIIFRKTFFRSHKLFIRAASPQTVWSWTRQLNTPNGNN